MLSCESSLSTRVSKAFNQQRSAFVECSFAPRFTIAIDSEKFFKKLDDFLSKNPTAEVLVTFVDETFAHAMSLQQATMIQCRPCSSLPNRPLWMVDRGHGTPSDPKRIHLLSIHTKWRSALACRTAHYPTPTGTRFRWVSTCSLDEHGATPGSQQVFDVLCPCSRCRKGKPVVLVGCSSFIASHGLAVNPIATTLSNE